ncbi:response regulator transcription factor [Anaerosporobacter faecicola]|uniref:response regulator transcription factor n=1 Tax=Anaerosporobacter faecicola TaxID=2718714 RepID=UPI00143C70EF|nr:response regulator [Anaerosporobacter faecicola]
MLIVEDEKMIRQGIKAMALRSGVPIAMVMECKNGIEALDIAQTQEVDVVITDIRMPKMDGITLVKELQNCKHVPLVVVVSGYDDFSYAVELLRYGVKDYLLKPIERTQLAEILNKLEEELQKNQQTKNAMQNIGYQQLKELMLHDANDTDSCKLIIEQVSSNFLSGSYQLYCTNYEGEYEKQEGVWYLPNVNQQSIFIVEIEQGERLRKTELRGYYVGKSQEHRGLEELHTAYKEAYTARLHAFLADSELIVYEPCMEKEGIYKELEQEIEQIVQMVGTDKCQEACKSLEYISYQFRMGQLAADLTEKTFGTLRKRIYETYRNAFQESIDQQIPSPVLSIDCLSDYVKILRSCMEELNQCIMTQYDDFRNKQKIQTAISYIKEHYTEDLNMAVVSNHISMNYSLFSLLFKQYTGNNFVHYLKEIRVEEAKRLLSNTDMKIADVGKAVGYENDKHFMKIFKGQCGVSPTEYRKNALLG